jgi:hypothetical protein
MRADRSTYRQQPGGPGLGGRPARCQPLARARRLRAGVDGTRRGLMVLAKAASRTRGGAAYQPLG